MKADNSATYHRDWRPVLTPSCALLWCTSITNVQITPLITFMLLTVVCAMIAIPYFIIFRARNVFVIMKRRGNYLWSLHNFLYSIVSHKISCLNPILVPLNPSLFSYVSVCFGIYYSHRNLLPNSWLGIWKQSSCIECVVCFWRDSPPSGPGPPHSRGF